MTLIKIVDVLIEILLISVLGIGLWLFAETRGFRRGYSAALATEFPTTVLSPIQFGITGQNIYDYFSNCYVVIPISAVVYFSLRKLCDLADLSLQRIIRLSLPLALLILNGIAVISLQQKIDVLRRSSAIDFAPYWKLLTDSSMLLWISLLLISMIFFCELLRIRFAREVVGSNGYCR